MDKTKNTKKRCAAVLALSLFFFFKVLLMIPEQYLGISVAETKFLFSARTVLMWVLLILFSVLAAVTAVRIHRKGGESVTFFLILLIADPLSFTLENNCLKLIVSCIGLIFVLNALRDKPILKNEFTFCLFVLISSFLMPKSLFSFIPLALTVYIFSNLNRLCENAKRWIVLIPAFACTAVGFGLNKLLCRNFRSVYTALRHLSFGDWEQVGSSRLLMLTAVPVLIVGLFCLSRYGKEQSQLPKHSNDGKYLNLPYDLFVLCYILSVIGFFLSSSEAFLTVNLILPAMFITMLLSKRTAAVKTAEVFGKGIQKHAFLAAVVLVLYSCFSYAMLNNYIQSIKFLYYAIEY